MRAALMSLLAIAILLSFGSETAHACSCEVEVPDGFVPRHRDNHTARPLVLPRNAHGVLFHYRPEYYATRGAGRSLLVLDEPKALRDADFSAVDSVTKKTLPLRLRRLEADERSAYDKIAVLADRALADCDAKPRPACELLEPGMDGERWLESLLERKVAVDVTASVIASSGLFRIEPVDGFEPGHEYVFTYGHAEARFPIEYRVRIATEPLTPTMLTGGQLLAEGLMAGRTLSLPHGGSCSEEEAAVAQNIRFDLSPGLEPFKEAMLFFVRRAVAGGEEVWSYRGDLCSVTPYGGSTLGLGVELVYRTCARPLGGREWPDNFLLRGSYGLLQVEDELRSTPELSLSFERASSAYCTAAH